MTKQGTRKLNFSRRLLLAAAGIMAVALPLLCGLADATQSHAQTTPATAAPSIAGTWQGTLHVGNGLRTVVKITKAADGTLKGAFYSIDQGSPAIPITSTTVDGSTVKFTIELLDGSYEGKLSADGNSIAGTWKQGPNPLPLNLVRATPATEWTIPAPPARIPAMAADANPSFEVATIKPSKPDTPGKYFVVRGRHFITHNVTLDDIMVFAYGVQRRQIIGAQDWMSADKYDIDAVPNAPGQPSQEQWKTMLQKLLANRYQLKFHHEKRDLTVYAITVGKNGPKLTKSSADPNGLPGLFFRQLGVLTVRNATMTDFARLMQQAVFDRPVVDQTGLKDRYDFLFKWTPNESQFADMGGYKAPATLPADAPPDVFTAIQEQLGLKLVSTKAPVDVMVIDHVEKPSPN